MSFEDFRNANADGDNDLDPPADGVYDCAVTVAEFFESKAGKPFVKIGLKVARGAKNGEEWTLLLGFKSQGQANMTKKTVRGLGVDVDAVSSWDELNQKMDHVVGQYFTVEVKTNGEFRNTYIMEGPIQLGGSDIPPPDMASVMANVGAGATDDSDVPF